MVRPSMSIQKTKNNLKQIIQKQRKLNQVLATSQSQDNQPVKVIEEERGPVKITDEERERIDILEQEADPSLEVPTTEVPSTEIDPIDESLKQTQEQIDYYEGLESEPDYSFFGN